VKQYEDIFIVLFVGVVVIGESSATADPIRNNGDENEDERREAQDG